MKTLIIFDTGERNRFAWLDGDYRRFHNQYIGNEFTNPLIEHEMLSFFFEDEKLKEELFLPGDDPFVIQESKLNSREEIFIIICGQVP